MQKTIDGRTYCTFEYILTSPNFSRAAFATIAIGNGTILIHNKVSNYFRLCHFPSLLNHMCEWEFLFGLLNSLIMYLKLGFCSIIVEV